MFQRGDQLRYQQGGHGFFILSLLSKPRPALAAQGSGVSTYVWRNEIGGDD